MKNIKEVRKYEKKEWWCGVCGCRNRGNAKKCTECGNLKGETLPQSED